MSVKPLAIDLIKCDGGTQMRAELSVDVYMDYRDKILAGVEFPPLDVFYDGSEYWLADGFHRFFGHREAKRASVKCTVHNGTVRDAILFAVGANDDHGLKRSPQDKRNSVTTLLADKEWGKRSSRWIAETCKISQVTVEKYRKEHEAASTVQVNSSPQAEPVARVGKDGKARKAPAKKPAKPKAEKPTANKGGECKPGEHVWIDDKGGECCKTCKVARADVEPVIIPPLVPIDSAGFDPANIEAHAESFAANFAARVKAHNLEIERFARSIMEAFANPPASVWLDESRLGIAQDQIKSACATIRQAKVHDKPCPKCDGKGTITGKKCKWCHGAGFMPERSYEMAGGQ